MAETRGGGGHADLGQKEKVFFASDVKLGSFFPLRPLISHLFLSVMDGGGGGGGGIIKNRCRVGAISAGYF